MTTYQGKTMLHQSTNIHASPLRYVAMALSIMIALSGALFGGQQPVNAEATGACGIQIEIIAAPFAVTDSNKPGEEGPMVGTLGARITNTSGVDLENVSVHLGDGTTPGAFPASSGGSLSLLDALDATHLMTSLKAGESATSYWPVTYPPTYDVSYAYTVWTTTQSGCSASASSQITTQSEISATANKLQPTGG